MIEQMKSWILSGVALVAGMACVVGIWSMVPREDPQVAENRARFDKLSGQQQSDLRNKATAFVDPANESELVRLQNIHVAVKKNPALMTRLETLDTLLSNLDPETKAKLSPDGEFASDWADQVKELANEKNGCDQNFEFPPSVLVHYGARGPAVVVSGRDYEAFLNSVSEGNWGDNPEYIKFINGDDVAMRRIFKTLVLIDRSIADETSDLNAAILTASRETLIKPGTTRNDEVRKAMKAAGEFAASQPAEVQVVAKNLSGLRVLELGLWNAKRMFLTRCLARETVAPEVFTKNFKRSEQMELMSMAPEDAAQELKSKLVSDNSVADPEIARVNEILAETRDRLKSRTRELFGELSKLKGFSNRSFFGGDRGPRRGRDDDGRGDRGPGGRGPGGRPPGGDPGDRAEPDRRRGNGQPGNGQGTNRVGSSRQPPSRQNSAGAVDAERTASGSDAAKNSTKQSGNNSD